VPDDVANSFEIQARATADACLKDHDLARAKGQSPEQIQARHRVLKVFCEQHLPSESPETFAARVDFSQPLLSTNARGIDLNNPKSKGFLGLGRKPAYLLSQRFPPKTDTDPLYALEYFPLKS
jgi:hypothetical protein